MAPLHGGENLVPVAFDVCTVGVELNLQSGILENPFTDCNLFGEGDSNPDRNDA